MLQSLYILQTADTPNVDFNLEKNQYVIEGISIPENTIAFYSQISTWMELFLTQRKEPFELKVFLHYYNTSSNISLINFLTQIQNHSNGRLCNILWCYEADDEDMLYKGEELADITTLHFTYAVM
jgi:hypothetical protein